MIVISDTSPVTNLIQIGQLDLLRKMYKSIIVPQAVYDELCEIPSQQALLKTQSWILVQRATNQNEVLSFQSYLDHGEAEALVLAQELNADLMVMDEIKGRKFGQELGLRVIGLLGILIQAKEQNYFAELKPYLEELVHLGFRIKPSLYQKVLETVSEN